MIHPVRSTRTNGSGVFSRLLSFVFLRSTALLGLALMTAVLPAQAQSEGTAVLKGHVSNGATGQFLRNAVVTIEGTRSQVRTADDGYFIISGIPAGNYNVGISFTGLDSKTLPVQLAAGEEKVLDVELTAEVYVLDEFVVASEREGSAKAIQEQRESNTIKNIVAADSFGNMVDGNIGELMKNLPGITIDYADGEDAAKMRFRGMEPNLMSVTMNGNAVASNSGSTSREFALNDLAVQNIEAIEVNFAPTPDQPSNTMGGSVNFKTKSAFNQKGRRIRLDGNMSLNSEALEFQKSPGGGRTPDRKLKPGLTVSYSEAFGVDHPLGVSFVASLAQRFRFNNAYTLPSGYSYDLTQLEQNGNVVAPHIDARVPSVRWEERAQANERQFVSLNLDFKLSDNTSLFMYNSYTYDRGLGSYVHQFRINAGSQQLPGSDYDNIITTAGSSTSVYDAVNSNNTKSWNVNPGVKHRFGDFELMYDGYISRSEYDPNKENNFAVGYSLDALGFTISDVSSKTGTTVTQTAGADYKSLNNYKSLSLYQDFTAGKDTQLGGKFDAKKPFTVFGRSVILQVGGRVNEAERKSKRFYRQYDLTGNSGSGTFGTAAEPKLGQFADVYFADKWDFDTPIPAWVSPYRMYEYYQANPDKFFSQYLDLNTLDTTQRSAYVREKEGDRYSRERVWAGYGMATVQPFTTLTVVGGVRYEFTDLMAKGWLLDSTDRPFGANKKFDRVTPGSPYYGISDMEAVSLILTKQKRYKKYDKVFPNVQAKYEPIKNLIVRAAYTTNMGRPDLGSIMPGDRKYDHYNLIRRTNTKLMPQEGENFDFKVEYYLPRSGVASLTLFRQKIDGYITDVTTSEQVFNEATGLYEPWTVESKENAGSGSNDGFEVNYRQRLGFIAKWLDDVEIYAAFSAANPEAEYMRRTGTPVYSDNPTQEEVDAYMNSPRELTTIPLTNVVEKAGNVRLTYNGRKFTASVGAFWRDEFTRSINTSNLERQVQAADLRFDFSATYKLSTHWKAYFDWRNVTGVADDDRAIMGRDMRYYTSGMIINLGVRADL